MSTVIVGGVTEALIVLSRHTCVAEGSHSTEDPHPETVGRSQKDDGSERDERDSL